MRWYLILLFSLLGCKSSLSKEEYIKWFSDASTVKVSRTMGTYTFNASFLPLEYQVLSKNAKVSKSDLQKELNEINGLQYFELTVTDSRGDLIELGNALEVAGKLSYFSFTFQNDIYLVDGTDTLDCRLFHFVRSYDLKKDKKFLLAFEALKSKEVADKVLVVDAAPLKCGTIKLVIKKEALEEIPELAI